MAFAAGLLGAHVDRRAGDAGVLAEVFVPQRQAEIGDAWLASFVEQDIGRLDVAVYQAFGVGVVQGIGDGGDQVGGFLERRAAL